MDETVPFTIHSSIDSDMIDKYINTVNRYRIQSGFPGFKPGVKMSFEEREDLSQKLAVKIQKDFNKLIKGETNMSFNGGTFIVSDGRRAYSGRVDNITIYPGSGIVSFNDNKIKIEGSIYCTEAELKPPKESANVVPGLEYKKIIYSNGVTTIIWKDGVKTTVRAAEGEEPNPGAGIAYAFMKKALGNKNGHNKVLRKEVPKMIETEKKRRIEKDRKRMDKDLKKWKKQKEAEKDLNPTGEEGHINGENVNS